MLLNLTRLGYLEEAKELSTSLNGYLNIYKGFMISSLKALDFYNDIKSGKNCNLEGKESAEWKLIDGVDIIVHIFHPEKRKYYDLEKMWSELLPKERVMI